MTPFLARYFDPALEIPAKLDTTGSIEDRQIERLTIALSVVVLAGTIPRRLGGEATDEDLALDKKRSKRVGHALQQSLRSWKKRSVKLPLTDEIRRAAAQIDWTKWGEAHLTSLSSEQKLVSTWAMRNEQEAWGKRAIVRLDNEVNWITYALR
jgi:hypothetical protein